MAIGDTWGTREELLHPRGKDGRFIRKFKMAPAIADAISQILGSFRPRTFQSDGQAAQYLRNIAAPGRFGGGSEQSRFIGDFNAVQEDLRDGVINNESTRRYITMMDSSSVKLPDDLILSRVVGPDAFGMTPAQADAPEGGIYDLTGSLIADRGYSPMTIGTPATGGRGAITLVTAVPKGTKAVPVSSSLSDREIVLDRDQELQITKVRPDGRGGHYVFAVATPRTPGKTPPPEAGPVGAGRPSDREAAIARRAEAVARRDEQQRQQAAPAPAAEAPAPPAPAPAAEVPAQTAPGAPAPRNDEIVTESVGGGAPSAPASTPTPEATPTPTPEATPTPAPTPEPEAPPIPAKKATAAKKAAPAKAAPAKAAPAAGGGGDKLAQARTIADLRALAKAEGIKIPSSIRRKDDIRAHIQSQMGGEAATAAAPQRRQVEADPKIVQALDTATEADLRRAAKLAGIELGEGVNTRQIIDRLIQHVAKTRLDELKAQRAAKALTTPATPDREMTQQALVTERENRIREVYRKLRRPGEWLSLADLREALPDIPRTEMDALLRKMATDDRTARIIPVANLKGLTSREKKAALRIGDEENHAILFNDPSPLPTPAKKAPAKKTAAKKAAPRTAATLGETPRDTVAKLRDAQSREQGQELLRGKTKAELMAIADEAKIAYTKSATKDKLVQSIVQFIVGARLTGEAIRGETRSEPGEREIMGMTIAELRDLARRRRVPGYADMGKDQLLDKLLP